MKVLVTDNAHLYKTPDGKYYTPSIYSYKFFERYLNIFEEVRFVSKTKYVDAIDTTKYILVSGKGLEIYELPWYSGLKGMLMNSLKLIKRYRSVSESCDCYIFRVSQIESYLSYILSKRKNKPFVLELVNDPLSRDDMGSIFKWINVFMLKHLVKKANGVSYVTQDYLQQKYPKEISKENSGFFTSYYSSIELLESDIKKPKEFTSEKNFFEIIHVANTIDGDSKGHRTVLEVIKHVNSQGYNVTGCFIGEGPSIQIFEQYAETLNIKHKVKFIGRMHSKEEIIERLSKSDLFIFPSTTEGLPRSVIEAQAAGLPCLATPVGGTYELLEEKYLFAPSDYKGFSNTLIRLLNNPNELENMSKVNIHTARKYTNKVLSHRRSEFYFKLKQIAEKLNRVNM